MSSMGELTFFLRLQVQQKEDGIFISHDKYVAEILKKFDFDSVKNASTPIKTQKPLIKDEEAADVDVHLYRSMIGSLMYLTTSRTDIMYAVCTCSRFQVTPKTSHLHAVKRIFRYLKGKPKPGLWYPRVSSFDLEAYFDSDYAGANLDRKSTTGGCQFLGRRLIELLRAPTEGNAEAIVVPPIPAEHFELKHSLLNLVTSKQYFSFKKEDPHAHIHLFNKITSTMKYKDVPDSAIKLMLFPFSIDGPARIWLEKEPPRSITTWDDLVSKFINKFFPPSKTTNLRNEISNFQQRFDEPFHETWDRFKDLLHSLNSAAGGNLLEKSTQDALKIIENKLKVRTSRNKPVVAKVSMNTSTSGLSPDVAALTDVVKAFLLKNTSNPPAFC
ncbi:reverse transcriptase domain-containing protein [Tanacetum coccineum]